MIPSFGKCTVYTVMFVITKPQFELEGFESKLQRAAVFLRLFFKILNLKLSFSSRFLVAFVPSFAEF